MTASERHAAERRERTKMVPLPSDSIVPERDVNERPVLECRHLGIEFGGLKAVDDFNFTVGKTEIAGLIGPNGAGKTTVFNLLTKVYSPTHGMVMLDGQDTAGMDIAAASRAGVARTFQNIRLFSSLSVEDNVKIGLHNQIKEHTAPAVFRLPSYWKAEKQMHERALELLDFFDMGVYANHVAGSLPYGAQRRLEIVRALATNPKLLLLDEPAAGMNPTETEDLLHCINTIRDRFGIAILLIEHDMSLVMSVCQRIQVLDYGRTIASGTPEEIANNPQVISAYLGSDNNDDADGDSTTKAEPEPSIAKTLTEGAR